ncbi:MAG: hypothetical protein MUC63_10325 [Planctomycetes bacterium]|nr:hypothetical protein [Planctomycetota bacterium]
MSIPLALAALASPALSVAQEPPAPSDDQIVTHARKHALGRLLGAFKGRLMQLRMRAEDVDRLLEGSGFREELPRLVRGPEGDAEKIQSFDDGAREVRLTVRMDVLAGRLRELAARKGLNVDPAARSALDGLLSAPEPFLKASGLGIPRVVAWSGREEAPGTAAPAASDKVRTQTERAAGETALRDLWKAVEGLAAGESLYVGAFLRSKPGLKETLEQNLGDRIERAPARFLPGGICEVDVFLDIGDLADGLETVARLRSPPESPWRKVNRERLIRSNGDRWMLWAVGTALLPSARVGTAANALPEWYLIELTSQGVSPIPDQAESEEAAFAQANQQAGEVAYSQLFLKIRALRLPSGRTLAELAEPREGDEENPASRWSLLHGAMYRHAVRKVSMRNEGEVCVEVQIPLARVWELVKDWE